MPDPSVSHCVPDSSPFRGAENKTKSSPSAHFYAGEAGERAQRAIIKNGWDTNWVGFLFFAGGAGEAPEAPIITEFAAGDTSHR